ncbi:MAG: hypothetical protein NTZ65_01865 [Candidatus Berkelbacteria bacterium]|nr:hypothetical protein [Candidatus Berkelbacteria bacterium]
MPFATILILSIVSRFIPHAANFTAVGGLTIFASKKLGVKNAIIITLTSAIICDIFLGFSFASIFVYVGMIGYAVFGKFISKKISYIYVPVIGSIFFFLVSNFGVFLGPWYIHNFSGLTACFTAALPFFKNTLISDIVFTLAIFSFVAIYKKIKEEGLLWGTSLQEPILKKK